VVLPVMLGFCAYAEFSRTQGHQRRTHLEMPIMRYLGVCLDASKTSRQERLI